MKLCRFDDDRFGIADPVAGTVADVTAALDVLPVCRYPLPRHDLLIAHLPAVMEAARRLAPQARTIPLSDLRLRTPVANPGKIIGAPINYDDHISEVGAAQAIAHGRDMSKAEIGKWGMFLKAGSALVGPADGIVLRRPLPGMENRNDHEVELVAVIGRRGTCIPRGQAMDYVAGYSIGLDMTLRGPQVPSFRKSIDSYAVLGPWLVTADEFGSPAAVDLSLSLNGVRQQASNTRMMVYDLPRLIEFASSFYTLEPGDLIYTGTPAGVGPVAPGDEIAAEIAGIGTLSIRVGDKVIEAA